MASVIDNVKAHFDSQEVKILDIPEWGDEEGPLKIYVKPLTLAESKRLYKMATNSDLEVMVNAIILKALDKDGKQLFTIADKPDFMHKADVGVISLVAADILGSIPSEDAEKF